MEENINILLVEDDEADQMAFKRFVKKRGLPYTFAIACSVAAARGLLQQGKFDVVLTDHQLPDGSAMDVISVAGAAPTIVVTGQNNEGLAVDLVKAGASSFLVKDHESKYLNDIPLAVQNVLARSRHGQAKS